MIRAAPGLVRLIVLGLALVVLAGCETPPVRVVARTKDQIAICRDTEFAEAQDAEDIAASFCAGMGLQPRLAATERCSRRAVRYNYICVARGF